MPRSTRLSILFVIVLVALAVRLVGLQFGLPYAYARPDETEAAGPAVTYLTSGSLRPQFFQWPSLFSYVVAALYALYGGVFGFLTGHASVAAFVESRYEWFAPFLVIPRAFSMTMGVITVGVVSALGRRLFDDVTALVGSLFLALCFLHVRDSHFAMSDVTMTLFVVLAVLATVRWQQEGGVSRAVVAGMLVGLAGATKYNGLASAAAFVVAAAMQWHARRDRSAPLALVAFAVAALVAFFAGSPYIAIDWSRFVADVSSVQATMARGHGGMQISRGWWYFGTVVLPAGLGWPLYVVSLFGVAGLLVSRVRPAAVLLAFPLAYYFYAGQSYAVFARYILPVVPFLCVAAAWLVVTLVRLALASQSSRQQVMAIVGLTLAIVAPSAWSAIQLDRLLARTDNRVVTANALATILPADDLIYQSGSSYGRVPLGLNGHGAALREATFDADAGTFSPAEPTWVLVQRSPLVMYSRVPETLTRVLAERYTLVSTHSAEATPAALRVYDQQDAFYLPLAGFAGLRRPGPSFELYRLRARQAW